MAKKTFDEDGNAIGDDLDIAKKPQPVVLPAMESESDDDEAPEAVSTKTARSAILEEEKAKRDLAARAAALEKEKRRLRDQKLKEQKQNSKRQKKTKEVEVAEEEEEKQAADEETVAEQEEEADESSSSNNDNNTNTTASDTRLLPAELLAQAAADEKSIGKRSHLTAADFERMEKEEQEKAAERMNKKRKRDEHRVGEYTVKVINNRPRPAPTDAKILNFKKRSLQRKAIPRKDALLQKSQHKKNIGKAALQFHRR